MASFDTEYYMHGLCQYFALGFSKLFNSKVILWLDDDYPDEDDDIPITVLCHAFTQITKNLFVDAYGMFKGIDGREDEFDYYEIHYLSGNSKYAKKTLKEIGVPTTESNLKKEVKNYLRNNMLAFKLNIEGGFQDFGLYHIDDGYIYLVEYYKETNSFGETIYTFNKNVIDDMFVEQYGFVPNNKWYKRKQSTVKKQSIVCEKGE